MAAFDVVIGCDLVYDSSLVEPLTSAVTRTVAQDGIFLHIVGGKR